MAMTQYLRDRLKVRSYQTSDHANSLPGPLQCCDPPCVTRSPCQKALWRSLPAVHILQIHA